MQSTAVACLLLVALTPLVAVTGMMYPSIVPKAVLMRSAVGIGTALLAWGIVTRPIDPLDHRDPILWSLAALFAILLLSGLAGSSPHHSLFGDFERSWGTVQWGYLMLLYLLLRTFLGDRDWRLILRASLYVAVGVAAFSVLEFTVRWASPSLTAGKVGGTLGVEGYLGGYMVLAGGLALVVADRATSSTRSAILAGAGGILFGTVLLLSGSRAALVGIVFGAGTGLLFLLLQGTRRLQRIAAWVVGAVAVAVVAAVTAWVVSPEVLLQIPVIRRILTLDASFGGLAGRLLAWEAGLEGFMTRPLTGWGPENFDLLYSRFVDPAVHRLNPEGMRFDRAHNVLVGKLGETGLAGLAPYLALWGSVFWTGLRAWQEGRLGTVEAAALLAALSGYFVYLQFWFEDHSTAVVLITLAAYLRHRLSGKALFQVERTGERSAARTAAWGAACLGIAGLALWINGRSAMATARMAEANAAEDLGTRIERFEAARRLAVPEQRSIALEYASSMADIGLESGRRLRSSDSLRPLYSRGVEGADRALESAADHRPPDPWVDAQRGRLAAGAAVVFAGDGIQSLARESLLRAVEKSPALLEHRHSLATVQALLGDPAGARETLRQALDLYDGYGRTYYLLSQMSGSTADSVTLRQLRQTFWLDYYPEEHGYLRRTVEALLDRGEAGRAERLLRVYVASRYVPELRRAGDPFAEEREAFLASRTAQVQPLGREDRPYQILQDDLPFLALWPRAAVAAGDCGRAIRAFGVLLEGLSERERTASLRPLLQRQLGGLRDRC